MKQDNDLIFEGLNGQRRTVLMAFTGIPKTMLEVAKATGIERANITRYISYFKKHDQITLVRIGKCSITGCFAGFYKANMEGN